MTTVKNLYSDTLPGDMQGTVRSIPAGEGVDSFRTQATSYDENGKGWVNYDVAWQDDTTGLWTIEAYKSFLNDGEKGADQKKTSARNVSFFDALYHCAFSEIARVKNGEKICPDVDGLDEPLYGVAAQAAKQPLDMTGLPHPAVKGRILTDGVFPPEARALAKQTKGIEMLPPQAHPQTALVDFESLGSPDLAMEQYDIATDKLLRKEQTVNKFQDARKAAVNYKQALAKDRTLPDIIGELRKDISLKVVDPNRIPRDFMQMFGYMGAVAATFIGGMAIPLEGAPLVTPLVFGGATLAAFVPLKMIPTVWKSTANFISKTRNHRNLDRQIRALPDYGLKTDLQNFQTQIKAAHHFAKAANILETHGYSSPKHLKRAFSQINKGAEIAGMSAVETEQLRMAVTQKKFPSASAFDKKISSMEQRIDSRLYEFTTAVRKADDVPQLESKQEVPLDLGVTKKVREPV